MAERIWYRSLYWRIALGFVTLVAVLLTAQALVTLWMAGRVADLLPGRTPAEFADTLAADVEAILADGSPAALEAGILDRYGRAAQAFAVVLQDGPTVVSARIPPPPPIARSARAELGRVGRTGGPGGRSAGGSEAGRGFGRGRGAGRQNAVTFEFAPVVVAGETVGMVAVPAELPPLSTTLRGFGPALAGVGFVLLVVGTAAAALLVFRPAHRRLRALDQAARALGAGATSVRAPEGGGDEVASLAQTFNEMAEELQARSVALVDADRTRRQLFADISHELATPLAAIRGYAETLTMRDVALDDDTRRRYLQVITDETERLGHVVGDLLDLARLEGGGMVIAREAVPVDGLFARVRQRHEPILGQRRVALRSRIGDGIDTVRGDGARLEQALQNLAANAIRHTPEGGTVELGAVRDDETIRLTVDDTGPGIPADHLPHIFDRFYKVDASRTGTATPSGSGLGLSIVQAIVIAHGGQITASNRPEGGARFEVRLPLVDPADTPAASA